VLLDPDGFYDGLLAWLGQLADTAFVRHSAMAKVTVAKSIGEALDLVEEYVSRR
jgi:predicted Rossmann-fold nucleotide-binding protein